MFWNFIDLQISLFTIIFSENELNGVLRGNIDAAVTYFYVFWGLRSAPGRAGR